MFANGQFSKRLSIEEESLIVFIFFIGGKGDSIAGKVPLQRKKQSVTERVLLGVKERMLTGNYI